MGKSLINILTETEGAWKKQEAEQYLTDPNEGDYDPQEVEFCLDDFNMTPFIVDARRTRFLPIPNP